MRPPSSETSYRGAVRDPGYLPLDPRNVPNLVRKFSPQQWDELHQVPRKNPQRKSVSGEAVSALLLQGVLKSVQAIFGAAVIFALDRTLLATCRKNGIKLPTAPAGMLLIFCSMMTLHSIDPIMASKVLDWFGPARKFYRCIPNDAHTKYAAPSRHPTNAC